MLTDATCPATVSILEAMVFGADGACVDLGLASVVAAAAAFVVAVVVLKVVAKAGLSRIARTLRAPPGDLPNSAPNAQTSDRGLVGKTSYDGGPIRSARPR